MDTRLQSPGLAATFSPAEIETARGQNRLLSLDISLTKRCNLRCAYCYVGENVAPDNELRFEEITHVIDEARELGLKTLNLTGGEPLLHEGYFQIARYARGRGIAVLLFTNGTLVTRETARQLAALRVSACVKVDSLTPGTQARLAGIRGNLEAGKRAIANLLEAGYAQDSLSLSLNAVACRRNLTEIPQIWAWAREQKIVPFLTRLQPMGRAQSKTDLSIGAGELRNLFGKLSGIDQGFGFVWSPETPWVHGKPCRRHYIGCFIDSTGNVQPCSGVPIKAGNIRQQSLGTILSSAEVFKVARHMDAHIEGACATCRYKGKCYGCRSMAYCATGKFTAADPLCWNHTT